MNKQTMVHIVQNKADLDEKLTAAGDKLVLIDFFANWCGPCKIIGPKLEELSELYSDKALVLKVDVDDCEDIALEYNVTSMPTFVFIKNKHIIDIFVGGNSEKLVKSMEKFILDENVHQTVTMGETNETEVTMEAAPAVP